MYVCMYVMDDCRYLHHIAILGVSQVSLFESSNIPEPHLFVEKQIVIVSVPDAYVTIADMVPVVFTDCEVYRVSEIAVVVCFMSIFKSYYLILR